MTLMKRRGRSFPNVLVRRYPRGRGVSIGHKKVNSGSGHSAALSLAEIGIPMRATCQQKWKSQTVGPTGELKRKWCTVGFTIKLLTQPY